MNPLFLSLAALVVADQDPYQSIGQEVGSIYQRIGSIASAGTCANEEIRSVHDAAQTAIGSLRYQIGTIDWKLYVGASAASVYTSQLGQYIDGLSTVNQHLVGLLTSEGPKPTSGREVSGKAAASTTAGASAAASSGDTPVTRAPKKLADSSSSSAKSESLSSKSASKSESSSSKSAAKSESSSSKSAAKSASKSASSAAASASSERNGAIIYGANFGAFAAAFALLI